MKGDITTAKSFRTEDITHTPRKQLEDMKESYERVRGFEAVSKGSVEKLIEKLEVKGEAGVYINRKILMPLRGSDRSAGYDFFATCDIDIKPGEKALIWSNIKAYMKEGEVLLADVRSSAGIKLDLALANTIGVIDADYYNNPSNEGNIGLCLKNNKPAMKLTGYVTSPAKDGSIKIPQIEDLTDENTVHIKEGDRIAQLIFVDFKASDNCNNESQRLGGIGSTGR
jgi:dUTP pyrophosphatase